MSSELQRVAQGLVECLDQIPQLVGLLQHTANDLRQQAAYIAQAAREQQGVRIAAMQLDHAARACEEAAYYASQAPPKAHAWAMAMVGGTSPHNVATSPGVKPSSGMAEPGSTERATERIREGAERRSVSPKAKKPADDDSREPVAGGDAEKAPERAVADPEPSSSSPPKAGSIPGSTEPDAWSDPDARTAWLQRWTADPNHTRKLTSTTPWADFQRLHAGDEEVKLKTSDGRNDIWADGVSLDPDRIVAVEAKYVANPGRSIYEGAVAQPLLDKLLEDFDREMRRYGAIVRDHGNPVARLRLVASTERAGQFLGERARRILGSDIDIEVQVRPKGDHSR